MKNRQNARRPDSKRRTISLAVTLVLLATMIAGCLPGVPTSQPSITGGAPTATPLPEAMITFKVSLPESLPAGSGLQLTLLDEVTGLALNPAGYTMEALDATHYFVVVPGVVGSVIKYRYQRTGAAMAQEHISDGRAVRYRLYIVEGPGGVEDHISRWTDTEFSGASGRINGTVNDTATGEPLPNVLVTAGGSQTFTAADGTYLIEGLPPGVHNLVAYTLDGSYRPYQQGAVVAGNSATPAPLKLAAAPLVNVTFLVSVPENTLPGVPVRLAGSLYQLGNTFADLSGGVNTITSRMPVLTSQEQGRYSLTLQLPAGADIRYKYTLGDGLWNAEHTKQGGFRLRELIVPQGDITVTDVVETWSSGQSAPITFDITVPANTPAGEHVSIQFKPAFAWTEAIPMWGIPNSSRWIYVLYSPLDTLGAIGYRYCRNEQCGAADDASSMGTNAAGLSVNTSLLAETIDDPVKAWAWIQPQSGPVTVPNAPVRTMPPGFTTAVELQPAYHPSWQPLMPAAVANIKAMNANQVTLTPTWTFTRQNPPVLEPLPGHDPLWADLMANVELVQAQTMAVALFPTPDFPGGADAWWIDGGRDFAWWNAWFDRYRTFLLHHAALAQDIGAASFIIGGDWVSPAYPGGVLADGSGSGVPEDAEDRWRSLIADIRTSYTGELLLALPFTGTLQTPAFTDAVDKLYLLWSAPIADTPGAAAETMAVQAGSLLDEQVLPWSLETGKQIVIAIGYPSATGSSTGCINLDDTICISADLLSQPNPDIPAVTLNLDEQAAAYSAMLLAVNQRDWIAGVSTRGYYPPAVLEDKSMSVNGKPAWDALWYWYPRMLGLSQ